MGSGDWVEGEETINLKLQLIEHFFPTTIDRIGKHFLPPPRTSLPQTQTHTSLEKLLVLYKAAVTSIGSRFQNCNGKIQKKKKTFRANHKGN